MCTAFSYADCIEIRETKKKKQKWSQANKSEEKKQKKIRVMNTTNKNATKLSFIDVKKKMV